ncbi:tetratricopeptide repeat protein [Pararhodospirillum photometricum]|nr:hypothetical protein [Pararhodospirillum photometricum]
MGDAKGALAIWRHLKADTPADAPWAAMLDEQISVVAKNAGVDVETIAPQSALAFPAESWTPAKDAPAAMPAPAMASPEAGGLGSLRTDIGETERASIEAMVGGLKKKLETSPDDFDTWMMLARSQRVLQKHADAVESYGKALGLRPGDMEARRGMAFALIAESQAKGESEPPEALYMVMASILRDSPEDQEALFFVGLQAANKGDGAKARELWSRLLLQLPKESSLAGQIRARMEALPK